MMHIFIVRKWNVQTSPIICSNFIGILVQDCTYHTQLTCLLRFSNSINMSYMVCVCVCVCMCVCVCVQDIRRFFQPTVAKPAGQKPASNGNIKTEEKTTRKKNPLSSDEEVKKKKETAKAWDRLIFCPLSCSISSVSSTYSSDFIVVLCAAGKKLQVRGETQGWWEKTKEARSHRIRFVSFHATMWFPLTTTLSLWFASVCFSELTNPLLSIWLLQDSFIYLFFSPN